MGPQITRGTPTGVQSEYDVTEMFMRSCAITICKTSNNNN